MPDGRRPHLLYVAWGFPPSRSGGVYRALATANAFALAGWTVSVLTVDRDALDRYTGIDPSLERRIEAGVHVLRLPFSWPQRDTDIRQFSRLRALAPGTWRRLDSRRDTVAFPEPVYGRWRSTLERAALRVHREQPVDLVIASANPNVDFMAAWVLHRRHRVPYVMDYRDAWLLDVFSGALLHPDDGRAARLERRLVEHARELWFVNEPIRDWHRARYPAAAARMHVVANGFDRALVPPVATRASDPERGITFGYLGTISGRVPIAELIAGWRWARDRDGLAGRSRVRLHGYLGYYATPQADLLALVDSAGDSDLRYEGPVAKDAIAAVYASFDALLLAIGAGRYVTSGKVFEYMATGLPIVSIHDAGNAASDVLRGYPLWFPAADLTAEGIGDALVRAARAARDTDGATRAAALEHAAQFARDLQLRPRVEALGAGLVPGEAMSRRAPVASREPAGERPPSVEPAAGNRRDPQTPTTEAAPGPLRRVVALTTRTPVSAAWQAELVRTLRAASDGDLSLELWSWAPAEPAGPSGPYPAAVRVLGPSKAGAIPGDAPAASGPPGRPATTRSGATGGSRVWGTGRRWPTAVGAYRRVRRARPVTTLRRLVLGGVNRRFATLAMRDDGLLAAAERSDVVVAVDPAAVLAAWRIARRVAGPDVVLGLPAATRALRARATTAAPRPVAGGPR